MNNRIISLYVEIISHCNENCTYCYNKAGLLESDLLDAKCYEKLLLDSKKLGIQSVSISGGEPFLHRSLKDFILITKSLNLPLTIITNFTIYDFELYKSICENCVALQITIDGPTEEIHDYTRGRGTFNKILANIRILRQMGYKGKLNVRMNLHKKNYLFIPEMFCLIDSINANFINFALINPVGGGKTFEDSVGGNDDLLLEIQKSIQSSEADHKHIDVLFEGLKESIGCPYYGEENIKCGLRVSPTGEVFPCQLFTDNIFSLGNVNTTSIIDIINGKSMSDFIALIHMRKNFIPECHKCAYKCVCSTGCPAEAYNASGNIFSLNEKCSRNKKLFNQFFYHIMNEDNNASDKNKKGDSYVY